MTPQPLIALAKANDHRAAAAELKRHIRQLPRGEAERKVAGAILKPTPELEGANVRQLLLSIPWVGPVLVDDQLRRVNCSPHRKIRDLSMVQRAYLGDWLLTRAAQIEWARERKAAA